jgi:hypothetical protein
MWRLWRTHVMVWPAPGGGPSTPDRAGRPTAPALPPQAAASHVAVPQRSPAIVLQAGLELGKETRMTGPPRPRPPAACRRPPPRPAPPRRHSWPSGRPVSGAGQAAWQLRGGECWAWDQQWRRQAAGGRRQAAGSRQQAAGSRQRASVKVPQRLGMRCTVLQALPAAVSGGRAAAHPGLAVRLGAAEVGWLGDQGERCACGGCVRRCNAGGCGIGGAAGCGKGSGKGCAGLWNAQHSTAQHSTAQHSTGFRAREAALATDTGQVEWQLEVGIARGCSRCRGPRITSWHGMQHAAL